MSQKSIRIRSNVGEDNVVRVKMQQDIDTFEILSLKFNQTDTYKIHSSDYGMIVGRVLANEAFGIPNAKVSVFLPINGDDAENSDIRDSYPYTSVNDKNSNNIRYNLLPNDYEDNCQKAVGTFPTKREVLDNNTQIEVFDKYWKYTTVTNTSGDYAIFGVPIGNQEIHVDIDLSDIGILSQKPRDFIYKGYNINQFDNAEQFRDSTNLDSLAQIISQDQSVHVYPFWGDTDLGEIAISRCDIQVQYKFEPTCVFFGSIVTDDYSNSLDDKCSASKYQGSNKNLVNGEGSIEMIRQTPDGLIEEFPIQGNRLIDSDGVWCYQIPMNLDYISTDEYGNIIPTDNPTKGIPTRTRVRFRLSMSETGHEGISKHRAKMLIPNNPRLDYNSKEPKIASANEYKAWDEFGSATNDNDFRDLYWNNVYSIKSYIPKVQKKFYKRSPNFIGLKGANWASGQNPIPFNNARMKIPFSYKIMCILSAIIAIILAILNPIINGLLHLCIPPQPPFPKKIFGWKVPSYCPFEHLGLRLIEFQTGTNERRPDGKRIVYYPFIITDLGPSSMIIEGEEVYVEKSFNKAVDSVQSELAEEFKVVNLDLTNDWINGVIYLPLWFWRKRKKYRFFFGLFSKKAIDRFCSCETKYRHLFISWPCSLTKKDKNRYYRNSVNVPIKRKKSPRVYRGIIKEHENRNGLRVYYYSPGNTSSKQSEVEDGDNFTRLFATDIILLGSFNKCSISSIPNLYNKLPSSTTNIPPTNFSYVLSSDGEDIDEDEKKYANIGIISESGMDVRRHGEKKSPMYVRGLFYDIDCIDSWGFTKTCVNAQRMCELGVYPDTFKVEHYVKKSTNDKFNVHETFVDGLITKHELNDNESRAEFATLNHLGFVGKQSYILNNQTKYKMHKLQYLYPTNFDGKLENIAPVYTNGNKVVSRDDFDKAYELFRSGPMGEKNYRGSDLLGQPLYNNSFYFYFGLKDGSTAINKLIKNYSSDCFKKSKEYITINKELTPTSWCNDIKEKIGSSYETDKLAHLLIDLKKITSPYYFELKDEFGDKLEYGKHYQINSYGKTDPLVFTDDILKVFGLHNGKYTFTLTDSVGRKLSQVISLIPSDLSVELASSSLGVKYYKGQTSKNDICKNNVYGEVFVKSITLGREEYFVNNIESVNGSNDKFKLSISSTDGKKTAKVLLEVSVIEDGSTENKNFSECSCENTIVKEYSLVKQDNHNVLSLHVWKPLTAVLTFTEMCGEILSKNRGVFQTNVSNGYEFTVKLNGAPLEVIETNQEYNNDKKKWWLHAGDSKYYNFFGNSDKLTSNDIAHYHNYTNEVYGGFNNDGEVSANVTTYLNAVKFKLQSITNVVNGSHITNKNSGSFGYQVDGGKNVLTNYNIPSYKNLTEVKSTAPVYKDITLSRDSTTTVTCEDNYPNMVFNNFMYKKDEQEHFSKRGVNDTMLNPKYIDYSNLANYFAAFTLNGESKDSISIPKNAKVACSINDELTLDKTKAYTDNAKDSHFVSEFVDRRLDYYGLIIEPFANVFSETKQTWGKGMMHLSTINGVELAYDDKHNIISTDSDNEKLEYHYFIKPTETNYDNCSLKIETNTNPKSKKYYKSTLQIGSEKIDTLNCYGKGDNFNGWIPISKLSNKNPFNNTNTVNWTDLEKEEIKTRLLGGSNYVFGEKDKIIERTLTFKDIPSVKTITYNVSSCSLKPEFELQKYQIDGIEANRVVGIVQEGGALDDESFEIGKFLQIVDNSISDCFKNKSGNIGFLVDNGDNKNGFISSPLDLNIILSANDNSSFGSDFVYCPVVINGVKKIYSSIENIFNTASDTNELKSKIDTLLDENSSPMEYISESFEDIGSPIRPNGNRVLVGQDKITMFDSPRSSKLYTTIGKNRNPSWLKEGSTSVKFKYSVKNLYKIKEDDITIVGIKHTFNSGDTTLTKEMLSYNFDYSFDKTPIYCKIFDSWAEVEGTKPEPQSGEEDQRVITKKLGMYVWGDNNLLKSFTMTGGFQTLGFSNYAYPLKQSPELFNKKTTDVEFEELDSTQFNVKYEYQYDENDSGVNKKMGSTTFVKPNNFKDSMKVWRIIISSSEDNLLANEFTVNGKKLKCDLMIGNLFMINQLGVSINIKFRFNSINNDEFFSTKLKILI